MGLAILSASTRFPWAGVITRGSFSFGDGPLGDSGVCFVRQNGADLSPNFDSYQEHFLAFLCPVSVVYRSASLLRA